MCTNYKFLGFLNRVFLLALGLFLFTKGFYAFANSQTDVDKTLERYRNQFMVGSEAEMADITTIDSLGQKREIAVYHAIRSLPDGTVQTLYKVTEPQTEQGEGLLTIERTGREEYQLLFLPEHKYVKKLSARQFRDSVFGTDLTYEDFRYKDIKLFQFNFLREENFKGHDCLVLEATPVLKSLSRGSGYWKRLVWIRKDIAFETKVEYFDKKGRFIKTTEFDDFVQVKKDVWRPKQIIITSHVKDHRTVIIVKKIKVDIEIPSQYFTETFLSTINYDWWVH